MKKLFTVTVEMDFEVSSEDVARSMAAETINDDTDMIQYRIEGVEEVYEIEEPEDHRSGGAGFVRDEPNYPEI